MEVDDGPHGAVLTHALMGQGPHYAPLIRLDGHILNEVMIGVGDDSGKDRDIDPGLDRQEQPSRGVVVHADELLRGWFGEPGQAADRATAQSR